MRGLILGSLLLLTNIVYAQTRTAQGVWVQFSGIDNLAVVEEGTYTFNPAEAATYFQTQMVGVNISCTGGFLACQSSNQPDTPEAPPASSVVPETLANSVKCVFLDGGDLTATTTYSSTLTLPGRNGSGSWAFRFNYFVSPSVSSVSPRTAWNFEGGGNGSSVLAQIGAEIAGQSVVSRNGSRKYSFDLLNSDGSSRVQSLALYVNNQLVGAPSHNVVSNCPGCLAGSAGAVDFMFTANAGTNGTVSLLRNGDARTILNTDNFAGNNNGGSDGKSLAKAVVQPVSVELVPGNYNVKLTGSVKGIDLIANQSFSVTRQISVVSEGCSVN